MATASPYYTGNNPPTYHNNATGNHGNDYLPPRTPAQPIPGQQPYNHHGNQLPPQYNHSNSTTSPRSSKTDPDSKYSGGSISSGYRPPSAQSGGYRLAQGLTDSDGEGYLAPRSSAGSSYQFDKNVGPRNDSGVDIDHNHHHPDNRSSNSDVSSKGSVSFNPSGAPPPSLAANEKPGKDRAPIGRPDSIAYRSHDYEELPLKKDQYMYADVVDNDKKSIPTEPNSSSGSRDNLTGQDINLRRRQNPLYDAIIREDSKASGKSSSSGASRCLCVAVVIAIIAAVIALVIAIVAMSGSVSALEDPTRTVYMVSTPSYAQLQQAMDRIDELEAKYADLLNRYDTLHSLVTTTNDSLNDEISRRSESVDALTNSTTVNSQGLASIRLEVDQGMIQTSVNTSKLQDQISEIKYAMGIQNQSTVAQQRSIESLNDQLSQIEPGSVDSLAANLSSQASRLTQLGQSVDGVRTDLVRLRTDVQNNVSTIRKMPGPQGPPGVGNLSACWHSQYSRGTSNDPYAFNMSRTINTESQVVMSAECSTDWAATSFLIIENATATTTKYTCQCYGTTRTGDISRYCWLHLWFCPRISGPSS